MEQYNLEKAQEEAELLKQKIDLGEASNYADAEKIVDDEQFDSEGIEKIKSQKLEFEDLKITLDFGERKEDGKTYKFYRCTAYNQEGEVIDSPYWYSMQGRDEIEHEICRLVLNYSPRGEFNGVPGLEDKVRVKTWKGRKIFQYKSADGSWKNSPYDIFDPKKIILYFTEEQIIKGSLEQIKKERIEKELFEKGEDVYEKIREIGEDTLIMLENNPELLNEILSGKYKLMIGTDISGRLPTILLQKVSEKMGRKIKVAFVAGSGVIDSYVAGRKELESDLYEIKTENIGKFLTEQQGIKSDDHILIVEDLLSSGASIKPISEAINKIGAIADIATLRIHFSDQAGHEQNEKLGVENIFYGQGGNVGNPAKELAGIQKNPASTFSTRDTENYNGEKVVKARQDLDKVADVLSGLLTNKF